MKLSGILLAAGNSTRFGKPKLTVPLADGTQIGIQSASIMAEVLDDCIAVVRDQDQEFVEQLRQLGFRIVVQPSSDAGMGDSLALGVKASNTADGWLIALADIPWIHQSTIRKVINSLQSGAAIAAPYYMGKRGHPVGFSRLYCNELMSLNGDAGARQILKDHSVDLQILDVDDT